jgi:DNA repair protein RadA/Sms
VQEPAADLAVCLAIISAYKNKIIDPQIAAFGEVGLTGEVRPVNFMEKRINEAERLGFANIIIPDTTQSIKSKATLHKVRNLREAIEFII